MLVLPVHVLAQAFSFAAIGDTPYTVPRQFESFARLIERINCVAPAFTVHVGDFEGRRADFSRVRMVSGVPAVRAVWRAGRRVV